MSLTQGIYGARGNLELLACDVSDGLWVFWFNSDLPTDPVAAVDVPAGTWSAGLHFADGHRYRTAQIVQSEIGPNHLEVLALDESGMLQSWYWSPEHGFRRRTADAAARVRRFAMAHSSGSLHVTVETVDGEVRHLVSTRAGYPDRAWTDACDGPGLEADALGDVVAAGIAAEDVEGGTARTATSSREGGMTELTWRDTATGGIRHVAVPRG